MLVLALLRVIPFFMTSSHVHTGDQRYDRACDRCGNRTERRYIPFVTFLFALRRRSLFVRYIAISKSKLASEFDPRAVPPEIKFRASVTYYYYTDLLKHTFSFSVQIR